MIEFLSETVLDAFIDSVVLVPFLFLTYLFMEFLEHRTGKRARNAIGRAGRVGPLFGGILGAVPQCGFSAAASGLFAGRVITAGTLVAVFLSTSDEMIAVMLSSAVTNPGIVVKLLTILGIKIVCGIAVGFLIDLVLRRRFSAPGNDEIGEVCEHEHCNCGKRGILPSALLHTLKIWAFILAVTFIINTIIFFVGEDRLGSLMRNIPVLGEFIAGLIGLIPNCAASVVITELYVDGVITAGQMLAGLFTGAGVGVLILFRTNRSMKENFLILATLYVSGVTLGLIFGLTGFAGLLGL